MLFAHLTALSLLSLTSAKFNDWSQPCLDGECSWDMPARTVPNGRVNTVSQGSMRIWGAKNTLADITTAAGWHILDCNATAWAQEVRIVCPSGGAGCSHFFAGAVGGVNKIVRLPNNCAQMPFARVARVWTHQNQALPADITAGIKSSHLRPIVHGLAIDMNFSAVDPATAGNVNIAIEGTNLPEDSSRVASTERRSLEGRGLFDFIKDALHKFNSIDLDKSKTFDPVDFNKQLNLIDAKVSCPLADGAAVDAGIKLDVGADASAQVTLGVVATGTIIPPKIDNFNVYTGLTADITGTLDLRANAGAKVTSPDLTLFEAGIPGLNFPGILSVGPTFAVKAKATAALEADVDVSVELTYKTTDTVLFFPPSADFPSTSTFSADDSNLQLSVSPQGSLTGNVAVHLIPQVAIGIDALSLAKAQIFLNLDASATVDASLQAVGPNVNVNVTSHPVVTDVSDVDFSGCFGIGAGVDVNAGADASFFGLFDKSTAVTLFSKDFDIFSKCFGGATPQKRALERHRHIQRSHGSSWRNYKRQDDSGLTCLPSVSSDLTNLLTA